VTEVPQEKKEKKMSVRKSELTMAFHATKTEIRRSQHSIDPTFQAEAVMTPGLASADGDHANEDDVDAELKMMIERMKQMKSRDPSKFQQLFGALTQVCIIPTQSQATN
jgi:hypothetical protein